MEILSRSQYSRFLGLKSELTILSHSDHRPRVGELGDRISIPFTEVSGDAIRNLARGIRFLSYSQQDAIAIMSPLKHFLRLAPFTYKYSLLSFHLFLFHISLFLLLLVSHRKVPPYSTTI